MTRISSRNSCYASTPEPCINRNTDATHTSIINAS
jgi:hypothetical protein